MTWPLKRSIGWTQRCKVLAHCTLEGERTDDGRRGPDPAGEDSLDEIRKRHPRADHVSLFFAALKTLSEWHLRQTSRKEHSYEVWMPASPEVSQRDFVVKQNNERFSIGPVRRPSNRGNLLQQHFNLAYLDSPDIRYLVPIDGSIASPTLPWPETRYSYSPFRELYDRSPDPPWPTGPDAATPLATEDARAGNDPTEVRARTGTGSNINY